MVYTVSSCPLTTFSQNLRKTVEVVWLIINYNIILVSSGTTAKIIYTNMNICACISHMIQKKALTTFDFSL